MSRKDTLHKYNTSAKRRAAAARWRGVDNERARKYQVAWRKKNPESVWRAKLKHRYGFVPPRPPQNCEACGTPFALTTTHHGACCDHDHKTNKFRGWICNDCNLALGRAGDSRDRLQLLINYLDRHELCS